tara:strand:+ start:290 stop:553 length:264 start_codon:yes stop_codon:yes gene_type:complete
VKFNFDIECTPEEARRFIGLPDVAKMQEALMQDMQKRLQDNMKALDPETIVNAWFPASMQSLTDMQKIFWSQLGVSFPEDEKTKKKK